MRSRKYRVLKTIERQLTAKGIVCHYEDLEVRGANFVVYFAGVGPASNGERFAWQVLRFNPHSIPDANRKARGDIDFTDFHTRDIPEADKGNFDAGVRAVISRISETSIR